MVNVQAVAFVHAPLSHQMTTGEMAINYAVLVIAVITVIHAVYLLGSAVRRGIAHRAAFRKRRRRVPVARPALTPRTVFQDSCPICFDKYSLWRTCEYPFCHDGRRPPVTIRLHRDGTGSWSPERQTSLEKARQTEQDHLRTLESLTPTADGFLSSRDRL